MRLTYSSGPPHFVTPLLAALFFALHHLQQTLASPLYLDASLSIDLGHLSPQWDFIVVGGGTGESSDLQSNRESELTRRAAPKLDSLSPRACRAISALRCSSLKLVRTRRTTLASSPLVSLGKPLSVMLRKRAS